MIKDLSDLDDFVNLSNEALLAKLIGRLVDSLPDSSSRLSDAEPLRDLVLARMKGSVKEKPPNYEILRPFQWGPPIQGITSRSTPSGYISR